MADKKIDFLGFGDPFLDIVVELKKLPDTNTNTQITDYIFQGGGNVPSAAVAAARMGVNAALIGCVGDDLFGKMSLSDLEYNKVDTTHMSIQKNKKSNFCICVTENEVDGKEFISKPGDFDDIGVDELNGELFKSVRLMHVALITPAVAKACDIVHRYDGMVSIDANYYREYAYNYYDKIDIFIGSELYYNSFCEDKNLDKSDFKGNMQIIMSYGPKIVIFTFGADGCRGVYSDRYFEIPSFKVSVADTTGAGDVFHGAFDAFYLMGYDVEECAKMASGVSAIKCTRPGGRSGIPTFDVLEKYLQTGKIDYTEIDERVAHYKNGIKL